MAGRGAGGRGAGSYAQRFSGPTGPGLGPIRRAGPPDQAAAGRAADQARVDGGFRARPGADAAAGRAHLARLQSGFDGRGRQSRPLQDQVSRSWEPGRDFVWLTEPEWRSLIPATPELGTA